MVRATLEEIYLVIQEVYRRTGTQPCSLQAYVEKLVCYSFERNSRFIALKVKNFIENYDYEYSDCDRKELLVFQESEKIVVALLCENYYEDDTSLSIEGFILDKLKKRVYFFSEVYSYSLRVYEFLAEEEELNFDEVLEEVGNLLHA